MLSVRPARRDDLPRLVEIYNHYVEQSTSTFDTRLASVDDRLPWFETFSARGPHRLLVAEDGASVVGCASSSPYRAHPAFSRTVEVGIYLDPAFLHRGIGSILYAALFEALSNEDVHVVLAGIALPTKNGTFIDSMWMERLL